MSHFWQSETILFDGDEYFTQLISDIDQAEQYITVEMYIFNDDLLGKKLAHHLINAHNRGVKVQIIVDGVGSYAFFDKLYEVFRKQGMAVKIYNPLPFYHPYYGKLSLLRKVQISRSRIWSLNRRNHRKIVTIDQKIMYTGSLNFTAEPTKYFGDVPWKDMGIRVEGENVKFAVLNFKRTWKLRDYYRYRKQVKGTINLNWKASPLRLNQTLFMKRYYYKNLLSMINKSQSRIWLMTPYFIPKRRLIRSLGKAAKRGVDVRIVISHKTDVRFFLWLQYFYYSYLLNKGVRIYQYSSSVLHAKNYIIDDFITIGSTNLNHRSFIHDLEVDLSVQDEENKKRVLDHFIQTTETQKEITLEALKHRSLWERGLSRLFFLFKYWF
jgi:cardiolipin synthase